MQCGLCRTCQFRTLGIVAEPAALDRLLAVVAVSEDMRLQRKTLNLLHPARRDDVQPAAW